MNIQEFIDNHPLPVLIKSYLSIMVHAEIIEGDKAVDEECKTLFEQSALRYKEATLILLNNALTTSKNITDKVSHKISEASELLKTAIQLLPEKYVNQEEFFNIIGKK